MSDDLKARIENALKKYPRQLCDGPTRDEERRAFYSVAVEALLGFVQHASICAALRSVTTGPCDCRLDYVLQTLRNNGIPVDRILEEKRVAR